MNVAIRYYSKSGHTETLAKAISEEMDVPAKPISEGLDEDVDVLFLGSSIYGNSIDPAVVEFFNNLNVNIGCIVNFSTAGIMESTYDQIKELTDLFDIELSLDEFHCPGEFAGINAGRPNKDDVEDVKAFVKGLFD